MNRFAPRLLWAILPGLLLSTTAHAENRVGDANHDGSVDMNDAWLIQQRLYGERPASAISPLALADADSDLDLRDLLLIAQAAGGERVLSGQRERFSLTPPATLVRESGAPSVPVLWGLSAAQLGVADDTSGLECTITIIPEEAETYLSTTTPISAGRAILTDVYIVNTGKQDQFVTLEVTVPLHDSTGALIGETQGTATLLALAPTCGNDWFQPGEQCDDGNTDDCDGCRGDCSAIETGCGDGFTCGAESCDDGADTNGLCGSCDAACSGPHNVCGDGAALCGELCDDGYTDACGSCNSTCSAIGDGSICGDGERCAETEACDDSFADSCGTCNADCSAEGSGSECGDGKLCAEFEQCDDGFTDACGSCDSTCSASGNGPGVCGDSATCPEAGENCDDGDSDSGDGCSSVCRDEADFCAPTRIAVAPLAYVNTVTPILVTSERAFVGTSAQFGFQDYLRMFDLTDPSNPLDRGAEIQWFAGDDVFTSSGDTFVLAGRGGSWHYLQVYDISDASLFSRGARTNYGNSVGATDVSMAGDLVAVTLTDGKIDIWKLETGNPVHQKTLTTGGQPSGVLAKDTRVYVADGTHGLVILDTSTPSITAQIGVFDSPDLALDVDISGSFAFVADGSALLALDLADETSPALADSLAMNASEIRVSNGYAFVKSATNLVIVDVRDPFNMVVAHAGYSPWNGVWDFDVLGDHIYVADGFKQSVDTYEGLPGLCASSCGNMTVEYPEVCDDGNRQNGDGCAADCLSVAACGDGFTDTANGEACDDGFMDACGSCNADCSGPGTGAGTCGDGDWCPEVEACDDGYQDACGSCNGQCSDVGTGLGACGDGDLCAENGEACDDGFNDTCGSCNIDCTMAGTGLGTCGDGNYCPQNGETCDDGKNGDPCDGCTDTCLNTLSLCGDTVLSCAEECDDGNTSAGDGCSSVCMDETTFCMPSVVGSVGGPVLDAAVTPDRLYVTRGRRGVEIYDISNDPLHPALLGIVPTGGTAHGVDVVGSTLYVGAQSAGLEIYDVTTPTNVILLGSVPTSPVAMLVHVDGGLALATTLVDRHAADSGVHVIDVSDPTQPVLKANIKLSTQIYDTAIVGNIAYLAADTFGLHIYDLSDPATPVELGFYVTPGAARGVALRGNQAYIADFDAGMSIVDVTDPASPILIGRANDLSGGNSHGISLAGDLALVGNGRGLTRYDISQGTCSGGGACLFENGRDDCGGELCLPRFIWNQSGGYGRGLRAYGNSTHDVAYLVDVKKGLKVITDIGPETLNPTLADQIIAMQATDYAEVQGDYAYVADDFVGMVVVDISTPTQPTIVGHWDYSIAESLAVSGNMAYYAANSSGLYFIDISDPTQPATLANMNALNSEMQQVFDVKVQDGWVFALSFQEGLHVIDHSIPSSPFETAVYGIPYGRKFSLHQDRLYINAAGYFSAQAKLEIIDISIPAAPSLAYRYPNSNFAVLGFGGGYGFGYDSSTFSVFDVSDSSNLQVSTALPGFSAGGPLTVYGGHAYMAGGDGGVTVVDVTDTAAPRYMGQFRHPLLDARDIEISGSHAVVASHGGGLTLVADLPPFCMEMCGNSAIEAGEQCDDGNLSDGDGCSSSCASE